MTQQGIWVVAEQEGTRISSVSLELLTKARALKEQGQRRDAVTAVLLGHELNGLTERLYEAGAEHVILIDHPALRLFHNERYAVLLQALLKERQPDIVLMGATATGADLAPLLGAKLWTGVAAHCVDLRLDNQGGLVAVVPAFGGKVLGDIICPQHRPQLATVRPGILGQPVCFTTTAGSVEAFPADNVLRQLETRLEALDITPELRGGVPLEGAEVVVAGGFGIENETIWRQLEAVASKLGGAVGCTRPPLDAGWTAESQMIGTSGKSVRPKVYLGVGISGATHHVCGMKDAGLVISINKDEQAPIFGVSDIQVTGDAAAVLPALLAALAAEPEPVCKV